MARIDSMFKIVREEGASDLHLGGGHAPRFRILGEIESIDNTPLSDLQPREVVYGVLTDIAELLRQGEITPGVAWRNESRLPRA